MPRRARTAAAVTGVGVLLAACGGGESGGDLNPEQAAEGGTITFANWQWLEPGRGDTILDAVNLYTEENPNATIETQEIARADYERTISTQIGGGSGPCVFIIPDAFFPELADSGSLVSLDDVVAESENADALRDLNDAYTWEGEQLALAWEVVPYALYWNKDILAQAGVEPPTTVDELIETAGLITERTGTTGFTVRHQMNEETPWWTDHSTWTFGFGGSWAEDGELTINSEENIAAEEAFQRMYNSPGFGVGDDASTYRSRFAAGDLGMGIDNSSAVLTMVSGEGSIDSASVGAAPLPLPGGGSAFAGFGIGINANCDNIPLALDFMSWLITPEAQDALAVGLFPSGLATDVAPPEDLLAQHPWVEAFFTQLEMGADDVVIDGFETETPEIRTIVLSNIERMLTEGLTPEEALNAAQEQAQAAVE